MYASNRAQQPEGHPEASGIYLNSQLDTIHETVNKDQLQTGNVLVLIFSDLHICHGCC